jgi:MFS family permease
MLPNSRLLKATLTGALGGLLFGFDTVVISGAIDALAKLYHLSDFGKGWTVAIALIGTVVGSFTAGVVGQKLGSRETLRIATPAITRCLMPPERRISFRSLPLNAQNLSLSTTISSCPGCRVEISLLASGGIRFLVLISANALLLSAMSRYPN